MASEDWDVMREYKAEQSRQLQQFFEKQCIIIRAVCWRGDIVYKKSKADMVKLSKGEKSINIYPKSKRYYDLTSKERGDYHSIGSFLEEYFGLPKYKQ